MGVHRATRRPWVSLADLRAAVRLTVLVAVGGLLLWAFVPYAAGWHTTLVTSGSMEPGVRTGDLVVLAPLDAATARRAELRGVVVQFDDPVRPGRLLLHRVVDREAGGALVTKGDANVSRDYAPVRPEHVRGVARLRVPFAGLPVLWAQTGQPVPLVALAFVILVLAWPERSPAPSPERPASICGPRESGIPVAF